MSAISDYAISRSIRSAARYFDAALDLDGELVVRDQILVGFREGFSATPAYEAAAVAFYDAVSVGIQKALHLDLADDSASAWNEALDRDIWERGGWVHRVILVMLAAREHNDGRLLGDVEFELIRHAIERRARG